MYGCKLSAHGVLRSGAVRLGGDAIADVRLVRVPVGFEKPRTDHAEARRIAEVAENRIKRKHTLRPLRLSAPSACSVRGSPSSAAIRRHATWMRHVRGGRVPCGFENGVLITQRRRGPQRSQRTASRECMLCVLCGSPRPLRDQYAVHQHRQRSIAARWLVRFASSECLLVSKNSVLITQRRGGSQRSQRTASRECMLCVLCGPPCPLRVQYAVHRRRQRSVGTRLGCAMRAASECRVDSKNSVLITQRRGGSQRSQRTASRECMLCVLGGSPRPLRVQYAVHQHRQRSLAAIGHRFADTSSTIALPAGTVAVSIPSTVTTALAPTQAPPTRPPLSTSQ
jgi:hypothetical protein